MKTTIKIGTRASKLALWQANWVKSELEKRYPDTEVTLTKIKTQGDKILDVPLAMVGGKGLFVKEIQEAMLRNEIDIAVHSMKDVPTFFPEGTGLRCITEREDPRDGVGWNAQIGWLVPKKLKLEGLGIKDGIFYAYTIAMMRYVIPPTLTVALILGLMER